MASRLCPFCMQMADSDTCPHCGKNINYAGTPMHLPAGYVVDGKHPYVIGAALGQGGFGITYIALDMVTNERVAVKEYFPTFCCGRTSDSVSPYPNQGEVFQKGKDRFLDEARVLKSLSDLKSIVNVLDFFEFNNSAYLVMEYLDGTSLKDHAAKNGKFPAQTFLTQIQPLMEDIERMHQRGVVHRDIAPDNIILLPDGQMKLIDFGAARSFVGDKSMTVVVKKGFAPVEQYMTKGATAATDVYALAATMYYCITGVVPLDSAERQYDGTPLQSPTSLGVDITPEQEKAMDHALAIMPSDRTPSAEAFLKQLNETPATAPQRVYTTKPKPKKKKELTPIIAAIALVLIIFVLLANRTPANTPSSMSNTNPTGSVSPSTTSSTQPVATAPDSPSEEPISASPRTLMEDTLRTGNALNRKVFGSDYKRDQIMSITFLSSTEDAAEDSWDVSMDQDGTVLAWVTANGDLYDLYIGADGGVLAPKDCSGLFQSYENLLAINFNNAFDTQNVINMEYMFYCCECLTELDLSIFDTSNVTNMSYMFSFCYKLTKLDITSFDTANVTKMDYIFHTCGELKSLDLSSFDTTNVTDMSGMFHCCSELKDINLSNFNTTNTTDMSYMFNACKELTNLKIPGFDAPNVTSYKNFMTEGRTLNGRPWKEFFTK